MRFIDLCTSKKFDEVNMRSFFWKAKVVIFGFHNFIRKEKTNKSDNTGFTLVASIMLMTFAALVIVGVTVFVIQRLSLMETKKVRAIGLDLAHAGINGAVYSYRFQDLTANGYFPLVQYNFDPDNYFVIDGEEGGLLMVDTSTAALNGNGRRVLNLQIQNATDTNPITIDRMIVDWSGVAANRRLRRIRIDGSNVWSGNEFPPVDADISNFQLDTVPTIYAINRLQFSGDMTGATITVQFVMLDGTTKSLTVFPASDQFDFTVRSMGQTSYSTIYRTLEADYNAITGRITDYREIHTSLP